jgi:hypothetical protein
MAMIKYKVMASCTDRLYFSKTYEIDDAEFEDEEELMDHLSDLASEDAMMFDPSEWEEEGSEDVGGGLSIDEIEQIN